jgi:fatty acid amide hydrolase 2
MISFPGVHQTLGLVSRRNVKATEDADVVVLLKKAGGILIAVTNIPEYNLWCESRNNVYGQTLNPYNTTRTVGGSSGGEVRETEYSETCYVNIRQFKSIT